MSYDTLKSHNGQRYSGMPIGCSHTWNYPNGLRTEKKVAPDQWTFGFKSLKVRDKPAPAGSGASLGSQYHWYVLASQKVRKLDADSYQTLMEGLKFKVAHKRPHWRKWSCEYEEQLSEQERITQILEKVLSNLKEAS